MKYSMKYIVTIATVAILAVTCYQGYWLVNIYKELDAALLRDLQEAVRAADFEEIVHRVNKMRDENFGGSMDVTVGAKPDEEQTTLKNESKRHLDDEESQTNLNTSLPNNNFEEALRDADDVMNVGLSMQRGIHSGLDRLRDIDLDYYESCLSHRLDSLGVNVPHATLYVQRTDSVHCDTLACYGTPMADADVFPMVLDLNKNTEYQLLIADRYWIVLKQMNSVLMFSLFTLIMLILSFSYIINMVKKLKALDEMKTDFTNNITHELKTPIAVAYAANDALLNFNENNDPETTKSYLTISLEQLNLLSGLVEQILSLSMERRKNMKLQKEDVVVADVVDGLIGMHRLKAKDNVEFTVDVPADLQLHTDRMHFSNVVSNLIDNAIKYSDGTPQVTITAARSKHDTVVVTVADKGIGIPRERQQYIFDKFYRVPSGNLHNVKGYGLGLYYVKSMMERLGGSVSLDSEKGVGSTFKLTFHE